MSSPLDILLASDTEQIIIRCLTKTPQLTLSEIAEQTRLPLETVEPLIYEMMEGNRVIEQLIGERRTFSVRFSTKNSAGIRNLPRTLLDSFEQSAEVFLRQTPLTAHLSVMERESLLETCTIRKLVANEVLIWQGEPFEQIYVVRLGLLKISHLQKKEEANTPIHYLLSGEWAGLNESLSHYASTYTYTAVTESEILCWPINIFWEFVRTHLKMEHQLNLILSERLQEYQRQQVYGTGKVWAIYGTKPQCGATTVAINLALVAAQKNQTDKREWRVLLWDLNPGFNDIRQNLSVTQHTPSVKLPGHSILVGHPSGLDILLQVERSDYPSNVQLDILLTTLQKKYDYIICDTGASWDNDLVLHLRSQAQVLISVTESEETVVETLSLLQPYVRPNQKKVVVMNRQKEATAVTHSHHFNFLEEPSAIQTIEIQKTTITCIAPYSQLGQSFKNLYRYLSSNRHINIFIPSLSEKSLTPNTVQQIEATLQFLRTLFNEQPSLTPEMYPPPSDTTTSSPPFAKQMTVVGINTSHEQLEKGLDKVIHFVGNLKNKLQTDVIIVIDDRLLII